MQACQTLLPQGLFPAQHRRQQQRQRRSRANVTPPVVRDAGAVCSRPCPGLLLPAAIKCQQQCRALHPDALPALRQQQQQQQQQQQHSNRQGSSWYPSASVCSTSTQASGQTSREESSGSDGSSSSNSGSDSSSGSSSSSRASLSSRRASSSSSRSRFRRSSTTHKPGRSAAAVATAAGAPPSRPSVPAPAPVVEVQDNTQASCLSSTSAGSGSDTQTFPPPAHQQQQQQQLPLGQPATSSSSSGTGVLLPGAAAAAAPLSSQLPAGQVAALRRYLDHLLEVNTVMNLTAIRDPVEAWERHIEDSLALLPVIEQYACSSSSSSSSSSSCCSAAGDHAGLSLIDVGTGAGLPGMVLAVVRPHWQVTLLDSLRKRCDFLEGTASMLGLSNVRVVWCRAEEGGQQPGLRERYDLAVARAVAELRVLAELCLPFVKPGGVWVAAKGANPEDEVAAASKALNKLSGSLVEVARVQSWAPEGQRTAVVVRKVQRTPLKYPRQAGTPNRKPL